MEITMLLVPTYNDNIKDIAAMSKWVVKNLGDDVPIHFGRFVPEFKLKNLPRTPVQTMTDARNAALDCLVAGSKPIQGARCLLRSAKGIASQGLDGILKHVRRAGINDHPLGLDRLAPC